MTFCPQCSRHKPIHLIDVVFGLLLIGMLGLLVCSILSLNRAQQNGGEKVDDTRYRIAYTNLLGIHIYERSLNAFQRRHPNLKIVKTSQITDKDFWGANVILTVEVQELP